MPRDLNPYKLKRKWGRRMKKKKYFSFLNTAEGVEGRRSDFAWSKADKNPYRGTDTGLSIKKKIEILLFIASLGTLFWLLAFHPFFRITKISVDGLHRIEEAPFREAVRGVMDYKAYFLFPQDSYIFANVEEIRDILRSRFPIESISVTKSFPNTMTISVEEKISTVIYDNGKQYSYVGTDGKIVEVLRNVGQDEWRIVRETVTSTNALGEEVSADVEKYRYHIPPVKDLGAELGSYPIVYDLRGREGGINAEVLKEDTVQGVISWFSQLEKITDIPFLYVVIENELGDGVIKTEEGWELKVKLDQSVERQMNELQILLSNEAFNRAQISYVDLRYPGRIYWK